MANKTPTSDEPVDAADSEPTKKPEKAKKKSDKSDEIHLQQLRKAMGIDDDSVRTADQHVAIKAVIPTGMADLDRILTPMYYEKNGTGGMPKGFVAEFFGPHAGGKSSLCMKLAGHVTQNGGRVLWFDVEGSFVPEWAALHGVDLRRCDIVDSGKTGETYLEQIESVAAQGLVDLIVIDSVTAMVPKEILETELEKEARIGAGAKMMTRALPRIISAAKKGDTAIVFINQIRQKMGVMYGNPETTPYGEALKFYSSLRLRLSQVGSKNERGIMKGDDEIGIRTNVQIVKSRFGPPYKETIMPIYYTDTKPHPLDVVIDAALSARAVKSRSKRQSNGEIIQTFSFLDIKVEGIDEFKKELDNEKIKEMAKLVMDAKISFDPEILEYLKTLDSDPLEAINKDVDDILEPVNKKKKGKKADESDPGAE